MHFQHSFRQRLGRETGKINCRVTANFAMHRQIGGHDGQPTRHRLHQRMRERFGISRGYVNIAGAIEVMERAIRNRPQLDDVAHVVMRVCPVARRTPATPLALLKFMGERRGRLGAVIPGIRLRAQLASKKEFCFYPSLQTAVQDGHSAQQCFEIPVVIVVAHKEQAETFRVPAPAGFSLPKSKGSYRRRMRQDQIHAAARVLSCRSTGSTPGQTLRLARR